MNSECGMWKWEVGMGKSELGMGNLEYERRNYFEKRYNSRHPVYILFIQMRMEILKFQTQISEFRIPTSAFHKIYHCAVYV